MPKAKSFASPEQRMQKTENSIRHNDYETLIVFDANGNELKRDTQHKRSEVSPSKDVIRSLQNNILSHNHPGGSCFSTEDLAAAFGYGVREIRATTASGLTYCLRRNFEFGVIPRVYTQFAKDYENGWSRNWRRKILKEFDKGNYDVEQEKLANDYRRSWLKRNASKYGWTYREEQNNE